MQGLFLARAAYVADTIFGNLWPQQDLGFAEPEDGSEAP
jgi:hypothetical protein